MVDWNDVLAKSVLALVPAGATWLFTNVTKLRADTNAAFRKIRRLERACKINDDDDEGENGRR